MRARGLCGDVSQHTPPWAGYSRPALSEALPTRWEAHVEAPPSQPSHAGVEVPPQTAGGRADCFRLRLRGQSSREDGIISSDGPVTTMLKQPHCTPVSLKRSFRSPL